VDRGAAPLRRGARIQHPEVLEALYLGNMGVPVDHSVAVLEPGREPGLSPETRAGIVDHPDPHALDLDDSLPRQGLFEGLLVHVPGHPLHRRTDRSQLLEEGGRHEISAVQHELRPPEQPDALVRQRPLATRQVRIGDDGDADQEVATGSRTTLPGSCRKLPAFHTSSPSA
jgi:hypothetical protein